ncbi:MAG: alpha/beta fold hydrolase [Gemmatimonadaceae bacterium]|nr:alpha/beta fold hydrolase [Gemmatimonadaceae bacterium]
MEHMIALPHGTLAWEAAGPHDAAVTLVLVHGFPHDRGLWTAQLAAQAAVFPHARILVPDLPGLGRSTPLPDPSIDGYADAIAALLDHVGAQQAVIAGLSMGGYVAFAFWRRHAARVRALMLLDTRADADTDAVKEKRSALITRVQTDGVGAVVGGMLPDQLGTTTRASQPALVERIEVMLRRAPASGVIGAALAMRDRIDSRPTLETITVPTLVVVGAEDTLTPPKDAQAIAAAIRGSRLVTIPDAGHLSPAEQPDVVNAAMAEFLDVAVTRG